MPFIAGLDLGQSADFTALAILDRQASEGALPMYAVRHLERFELGMPYPRMMETIADRFGAKALKGSALCVDYTGVGRPVVDIMREKAIPARITPILITAGHRVTYDEDDRAWHVPKKELVSTLQVLLQNERIRIVKSLPEADRLTKELRDFRVKVSKAGNEQFGELRSRYHDDLVLAVMLACWLGEYASTGDVTKVRLSPVEKSMIATAPRGVFDMD